MSDIEARMKEYAQKQGISVDALRKKLDLEMKEKSGPTFDESLEKICYVIDDPKPPTIKYHRADDLLHINTDFMNLPEAENEIDDAINNLGIRPEVVAVMEVAVKVKPKFHSKKRKDEG